MRLAVRLERGGEDAAEAEWTGWVPLEGAGGEAPAFGELQMVLDLLDTRGLVLETFPPAAALFEWTREGDLVHGTGATGAFATVRLDGRGRIVFARSNLGQVEVRYERGSDRVAAMDLREGGIDVQVRWSWRDSGVFDLDLVAREPDGAIAGVVGVRVLEIDREAAP